MRICVFCGALNPDQPTICSYHFIAIGDERWAEGNRVMCDFVHRRIVPPRLAPGERADIEIELGVDLCGEALELVATG